jgi:hypothetical protein
MAVSPVRTKDRFLALGSLAIESAEIGKVKILGLPFR